MGFYYFSPVGKGETIITNRCVKLRLNWGKYIRLRCKLADRFGFPTQWSAPSRDICSFKRTIRTDGGEAQLERLCGGSLLIIENLIIVRNLFLHCLEGHGPNGYKRGDSREVVEALGAISKRRS